MPSDASKTPPLSPKDAIKAARRYLNECPVTWKNHVKQRMEERNISIRDVINTVEGGKLVRRPEWNEKYGEYNYLIRGRDIEGAKLTVKVAISEEEGMLTFITVF